MNCDFLEYSYDSATNPLEGAPLAFDLSMAGSLHEAGNCRALLIARGCAVTDLDVADEDAWKWAGDLKARLRITEGEASDRLISDRRFHPDAHGLRARTVSRRRRSLVPEKRAVADPGARVTSAQSGSRRMSLSPRGEATYATLPLVGESCWIRQGAEPASRVPAQRVRSEGRSDRRRARQSHLGRPV